MHGICDEYSLVEIIETKPPFCFATVTSPGVQVTTLSTVIFCFAGLHAATHDGPRLGITGDILLDGIEIIVGADPVERVGIPGFLVGIGFQAVVAQPFLRDIPVAIAQNSGDDAAFAAAGLSRQAAGPMNLSSPRE